MLSCAARARVPKPTRAEAGGASFYGELCGRREHSCVYTNCVKRRDLGKRLAECGWYSSGAAADTMSGPTAAEKKRFRGIGKLTNNLRGPF